MPTNKESLIGNVKIKVKVSLSWWDYEMGELRILRAERRAKIKFETLGTSGKQTLASLKICLEESHKIRHWREERPKKAE